MSFILLQYVPVPVLKNLGKIAIFFEKSPFSDNLFLILFFIQNLHCFASLLALSFLSAQNNNKQQTKKLLNHRIIIIHNQSLLKSLNWSCKNASTPPIPLKSSDDPFDPRHIGLVEMFRFVFKNWKTIHLFDKKNFFNNWKSPIEIFEKMFHIWMQDRHNGLNPRSTRQTLNN